jgi:hypothetical protein
MKIPMKTDIACMKDAIVVSRLHGSNDNEVHHGIKSDG